MLCQTSPTQSGEHWYELLRFRTSRTIVWSIYVVRATVGALVVIEYVICMQYMRTIIIAT